MVVCEGGECWGRRGEGGVWEKKNGKEGKEEKKESRGRGDPTMPFK